MSPLGHNRCEHCDRLSPLYQPWATCRSCLVEVCDQCDGGERYRDAETNRTTCKPCLEIDEESAS